MSIKTLLELTADLDAIDGNDINAGMAIYGDIHNMSEGIAQSVSKWVFRSAFSMWDENEKADIAFQLDGEKLAEKFKKAMQDGIDTLIKVMGSEAFEDDGGRNTLKLTGENPLSSAFRKVENGLKKELDLTNFISVRAIQDEVTRLNKEAKKAVSDEKRKETTLAKIKAELLEKSPELADDEEALTKLVQQTFEENEKLKADHIEELRAIEAVKVKHPVPDFMYSTDAVAVAMVGYMEILAERVVVHSQAKKIPVEIALEQVVASIEGEINRQQGKIEGWEDEIVSAAATLREKISA